MEGKLPYYSLMEIASILGASFVFHSQDRGQKTFNAWDFPLHYCTGAVLRSYKISSLFTSTALVSQFSVKLSLQYTIAK